MKGQIQVKKQGDLTTFTCGRQRGFIHAGHDTFGFYEGPFTETAKDLFDLAYVSDAIGYAVLKMRSLAASAARAAGASR